MKRFLIAVILIIPALALAGAIHVWNTGETLKSSDLNANFAHIHNLMVGGHGARLVDSDVSPSAAIQISKLANSQLVPKAWAYTGTICDATLGTACAISASSQVASIIGVGGGGNAGKYNVTLLYTPSSTNFYVSTTVFDWGVCPVIVSSLSTTAPHFRVECVNFAAAAANLRFGFTIFSN